MTLFAKMYFGALVAIALFVYVAFVSKVWHATSGWRLFGDIFLVTLFMIGMLKMAYESIRS